MDSFSGTQKSSKRKLLVPIVALMLCAVAVLGIGYAANSTITANNNTVDAEFVSLDMYDDNTASTQTKEVIGSTVELTTARDVGDTQYKVTYDSNTVTKYVDINTNKTGNFDVTVTVTGINDASNLIKAISVNGTELTAGGNTNMAVTPGTPADVAVKVVLDESALSALNPDSIENTMAQLADATYSLAFEAVASA